MPRDNLIRLLAENAWRLNTPDPRSGAADLVTLLEKELGPVPVALPATTAPQQVDFLARQVEDLKADKVTIAAQRDALARQLAAITAAIPASLSAEVPDPAEAVQKTFDQYVKVAAEATALRGQVEALTAERDAAREAGNLALEQLKKRKTADAVATLTDAAPAAEEPPAAPATDQAAA